MLYNNIFNDKFQHPYDKEYLRDRIMCTEILIGGVWWAEM